MSFYRDHDHSGAKGGALTSGFTPEAFAGVVGTVANYTEKPITGRNGDHLQFNILAGPDVTYQVDVNTQSSDGSSVMVYIATETLTPSATNPNQPYGAPAYGVFPDAKLSYAGMKLTDAEFQTISVTRIEAQLEAALGMSDFVAAYGHTFDDGGPNGKGVHDIHYTGQPNEDGALAIYNKGASGSLKRTWFFFRFDNQHIG
jgi:hypothetical protein